MNPIVESAREGDFLPLGVQSLRLAVNLAADPIAHRPPGRLAHRRNVPAFDQNLIEAYTLQPFDSRAVSTPTRPSSGMISPISDGYPPPPLHPQPPTHSDPIFSQTVNPSSPTRELPLFRHSADEGLGYTMDCLKGWHPDTPSSTSNSREYSPCLRVVIVVVTLPFKPCSHLTF
jgi:hypothetical protein